MGLAVLIPEMGGFKGIFEPLCCSKLFFYLKKTSFKQSLGGFL